MGAVRFGQSTGYGHFFPRFRIEVSDDSQFRMGVNELNRQFPLSFAKAMSDDRDIDPAKPEYRTVTYGARPTRGRYLRITAIEDAWATSLDAIEVYGP